MESGYIEIDFKRLFRVLRKNWWVLLVFASLLGFAAYYYSSQVVVPVYQVSTTIFVGKDASTVTGDGAGVAKTIELNDLKVDSQLINDMVDLLKTNYIIEKVLAETGANLGVNAVKYNLNVLTGEGSRFMTINFKGEDPWLITQVNNALADILVYEAEEIMAIQNARVLDYAVSPKYPVSPNVKLNTAAGIVLGLIIGAAIPLLFDAFDNTYRDEEAIKDLGIPLMGVIPKKRGM